MYILHAKRPNPAGTHTTPFTSPDGVPLHTALSELKAALLDGYDASTPPAGTRTAPDGGSSRMAC